MKPRTDAQRKVDALRILRPLTPKQREWAMHNVGYKFAMTYGKDYRCGLCGEYFQHPDGFVCKEQYDKPITCPHCGAKLETKYLPKRCFESNYYFATAEVVEGMQVFRNYIISRNLRKDGMSVEIYECVRNWVLPNGTEIVQSLPRYVSHWAEHWKRDGGWEVRNVTHGYDSYHPYSFMYPHANILPILRRNGFSIRHTGIPHSDQAKLLLKYPQAETLLKAGQMQLFEFMVNYPKAIFGNWAQIKIAMRNRYIIKHVESWLDHLRMLRTLQMDDHSPKYVCPKDFAKQHTKLSDKINQIRKEEERKKTIAKIAGLEPAYAKEKGKYFHIQFANENIQIAVLTSVQEFWDEAEFMHHCVFGAGYYEKETSLILSAKDTAGNRLETIEFDIKDFKILQSRGKYNQPTKQHDEIVALMNQNINLIRKIS